MSSTSSNTWTVFTKGPYQVLIAPGWQQCAFLCILVQQRLQRKSCPATALHSNHSELTRSCASFTIGPWCQNSLCDHPTKPVWGPDTCGGHKASHVPIMPRARTLWRFKCRILQLLSRCCTTRLQGSVITWQGRDLFPSSTATHVHLDVHAQQWQAPPKLGRCTQIKRYSHHYLHHPQQNDNNFEGPGIMSLASCSAPSVIARKTSEASLA